MSSEEKVVAGRFVRAADRARYLVAHVALRRILGAYLGRVPAELEFVREPFGKPALAARAGEPPLSFNLAHSGDVVLVAVSAGRRVGVDIEEARADRDVMALAESQFAADEVEALRRLDEKERLAGFYRCWTLKEAYIKARGEGLGYALSDFSVSVSETAPAVNRAADDPGVAARWSVFRLDTIPGYAGAAVCEGAGLRLARRGRAGEV